MWSLVSSRIDLHCTELYTCSTLLQEQNKSVGSSKRKSKKITIQPSCSQVRLSMACDYLHYRFAGESRGKAKKKSKKAKKETEKKEKEEWRFNILVKSPEEKKVYKLSVDVCTKLTVLTTHCTHAKVLLPDILYTPFYMLSLITLGANIIVIDNHNKQSEPPPRPPGPSLSYLQSGKKSMYFYLRLTVLNSN